MDSNIVSYEKMNILGLFMDKSFDKNMPKNLIKAELGRRKLKVKDLVELLKPYGENLTDKSYNNKMTRKGFITVFFCKCMMALGVKNLNLEI